MVPRLTQDEQIKFYETRFENTMKAQLEYAKSLAQLEEEHCRLTQEAATRNAARLAINEELGELLPALHALEQTLNSE